MLILCGTVLVTFDTFSKELIMFNCWEFVKQWNSNWEDFVALIGG